MTSLPTQTPSPVAVYTGRTTGWLMVAASSIGAFVLVFLASRGSEASNDLPLLLVLVAVGALLTILTASSVRATAGPNGLTIHWGPVGWPRCHYRLDEIETVEVIDLPWWLVSWGFWWTPKRTCCTVRSGPTVKLTLRNHRMVTVTVPDADAAVAALGATPKVDPTEPTQ